jgi:hypothetical protein
MIDFTYRELDTIRIGLNMLELQLYENIARIEKRSTPEAPVTPENNTQLYNLYNRLKETTDAAMKIVNHDQETAG